jgi:hypothetical protein
MAVDATIDMFHVYDHVSTCPGCSNEAIDYIFSEFAKDGVATNVSGIRQALRYFDQYLVKKVEGEIEDGETCTDNQSER